MVKKNSTTVPAAAPARPVAEPLPTYAPLLAAYHKAYTRELETMIGQLPLCYGDQVLDVGCGDGAYVRWMAPHVGPQGRVLGMDISPDYLKVAAGRTPTASFVARIDWLAGDIHQLPFADNTFDLVWCAQSLFSFPDALRALCEMRRVAKPRGVVAILEDDTLHQILLPWPVELELALRTAELKAFARETSKPHKYYVARRLRALFEQAGLRPQQKKTYASNRQAPLNPEERAFLDLYLKDIRQRTRPFLSRSALTKFDRWLDPESEVYLLNQPDLTVTCLDHVMWGVKPYP